MGKYFNDNTIVKIAMVKTAADPVQKHHHSNFPNNDKYMDSLVSFYKDQGAPDPKGSAKEWSQKNPWAAPPAASESKTEQAYKDALTKYYKPGSLDELENDKKVKSWAGANPWKAPGIADPDAELGYKNFKTAEDYSKAIHNYYKKAGATTEKEAEAWIKANPWVSPKATPVPAPTTEALRPNRSANRAQYEKKIKDYYKAKGTSNTVKQNEQLAEDYLAKNKYTEEGRDEENRGSDSDRGYGADMDKALDSPYAGATSSDVFRSVRRARMKRMFSKLRKSYGAAKAKDILNKAEAVARERRELVKSDIDRLDKGDPNSVDSMVFEIPESQARYSAGAKDFKKQIETLKVSHVPSGGTGVPSDQDVEGGGYMPGSDYGDDVGIDEI